MTDKPTPPGRRRLKLDVPRDLNAVYSNFVILSTTRHEIIIDFAQVIPTDPRARVQSRVIMSPTHAKMLFNVLQKNIARYEEQHGEIPIEQPPSLADQLFSSVRDDGDKDDKPNDDGDDTHE